MNKAVKDDRLNFKEKRADDLAMANIKITHQKEENEKCVAELVIANEKLLFQDGEKVKRAAELAIVNAELHELATANKDLVRSEEKLIDANDELESFSYSVAHDLHAPLRAISGYSQLLQSNLNGQLDAEGRRLMENIIRSATKMGRLIDDLLKFSHMTRKELVITNIHMQEIVSCLCKEQTEEQPDRRIDITIHDLHSTRGDVITIKQLWSNLISNAIKYSRQRATAVIEIGSQVLANEIVYYIKDNGTGFDMRDAGRMFDVFQRLHSDDEFEGTGVGLALVQRVINKHGGRVWGEGKTDKGATFFFTMKIA